MAIIGSIITYLALHFLRGSLELKLVFPRIEQVRFFGRIPLRRPDAAASRTAPEPDSGFHQG
jgi:hypothetical protein